VRSRVPYRCVATSVDGFVQQLAVSYIGQGYWFYVTGKIPKGKDPGRTDAKLIERYGVDISKWARARRKRAGLANVHYLRHERFFVLIATKGEHAFFTEENYRDVRRQPIRFCGYSISYRQGRDGKGHPSVRISQEEYRSLKAYFLEIAVHRDAVRLQAEFQRIRYTPWAPVRAQVLNVLRVVNRVRERAGMEVIPAAAVRTRRMPVRVFEVGDIRTTSSVVNEAGGAGASPAEL
jgi:hypothetical protein